MRVVRAGCPGRSDLPRSGQAWIVRTVVAILENPRYTGRQVWNRYGTAHGADGALHAGAGRWTTAQQWAVSEKLFHPALVDDATFRAVQGMRAARKTQEGDTRTYTLAGLVVCGVCRRRLDSHWVNNRPGYRCRHGHTSAHQRPPEFAKNVYVREDRLLTCLRSRLADTGGEDTDPADYLRSNALVIVYGGPTWTIEAVAAPPAPATPDPAGTQLLQVLS